MELLPDEVSRADYVSSCFHSILDTICLTTLYQRTLENGKWPCLKGAWLLAVVDPCTDFGTPLFIIVTLVSL